MKRFTAAFLVLPLLCLSLAGCAPLIVGAAVGALGGYAISKDTIQGNTDKNYDLLWESAINVARMRGNIKTEDSVRGYLELEVNSSKVYVRLIRLTQATTRLRVSAKRYHLPNLSLAEDIFVRIIEEAR